MKEKNSKFNRKLKNFSKGLGGAAEMLGGIILSTPVTGCVGIPIAYDGSIRLANSISKYENTDSIITSKVEDKLNRRIVQNMPNFKQMFELGFEKNKLEALVYQELKFLLNADKVNEDNETLNYNTKSQALTKRLLKQAERCGIITNFKSEKIGSKSLPVEKIVLGNINKDIFKKTSLFSMSFDISNKPMTKEMLDKFGKSLNINLIDDKKYNLSYDENGNVTGIELNKTKAFMSKFKKDDKKLLESSNVKYLTESSNNKEAIKEKTFNEELKEATVDYKSIAKSTNKEIEVSKDEIDVEIR